MSGGDDLRADCSRCAGLCCVVPGFSASSEFAIDKPAGSPCPNLGPDFRCRIHDMLRARGFAGCATYDCFGAGQRV
ncbi:MAG TPA: pentapeptide repeat-containing protein, partial [Micromonosporaceae bacterium]|nr:pentapeptide repeat-containing protein [Micromonosporaceae bacterium]